MGGRASAAAPGTTTDAGQRTEVASAPVVEDLASLSDQELLDRLSDLYSDLAGRTGEARSLLWDEILEVQRELQRRYPPSTDPR